MKKKEKKEKKRQKNKKTKTKTFEKKCKNKTTHTDTSLSSKPHQAPTIFTSISSNSGQSELPREMGGVGRERDMQEGRGVRWVGKKDCWGQRSTSKKKKLENQQKEPTSKKIKHCKTTTFDLCFHVFLEPCWFINFGLLLHSSKYTHISICNNYAFKNYLWMKISFHYDQHW